MQRQDSGFELEEDEDYTYEEDGEYQEYEDDVDGDENFNEDNDDVGMNLDNDENGDSFAQAKESRQSGASTHSKGVPGSADKKFDDAAKTIIAVPSDRFSIVDCSEIEPIMRKLIDDVASLLDLSTDVAQSLLQSAKWDREKLIDAFFANSDKVMQKAGLDLYNPSVMAKLRGVAKSKSTGGTPNAASASDCKACDVPTCRICYDDAVTSGAFSMGCEHSFCQPCYTEYLANQVGDGQMCIIARCPEFKCSQVVTPAVYHSLLEGRRAPVKETTAGTAAGGAVGDSASASSEPSTSTSTAAAATAATAATVEATAAASAGHSRASSSGGTTIATNSNRNSPGTTGAATSAGATPGAEGPRTPLLTDQYDLYFVRNFIETCKNMKYCPAPGCDKVAVGSGITTVRCVCGHPFCMRCGT
jgi:hypothetical protein